MRTALILFALALPVAFQPGLAWAETPAPRPNIVFFGEQNNLASQEPDRVAALRAKLEDLLKRAAAPGHVGLQ